jgi:hypothetical protein
MYNFLIFNEPSQTFHERLQLELGRFVSDLVNAMK